MITESKKKGEKINTRAAIFRLISKRFLHELIIVLFIELLHLNYLPLTETWMAKILVLEA